MALKMAGCALSLNTFARYYETHLHKKVVKDKRTKVEMVAHYGSYNFVLRNTKGTMQIVPALLEQVAVLDLLLVLSSRMF
jgi:hypothetical protein